MKAKKSYDNGGKMKKVARKGPSRIHTSRESADVREAQEDYDSGRMFVFAGGRPKSLTDAEDRAATKREREAAKDRAIRRSKNRKFKKGGRMGLPKDISGMGRFGRKLKKLNPLAPKKIDSGVSMDKTLKKSAVEVDNKKKRRKKRRKLENGGKVKRTANVNLRGEGKKKEPVKNMLPPMNTAGPDYGDYMNQERAAAGGFKKMDKIAPKGPDVIGLAKKVKPGTIKKSSAKIPVPAKKKRRLRRK